MSEAAFGRAKAMTLRLNDSNFSRSDTVLIAFGNKVRRASASAL